MKKRLIIVGGIGPGQIACSVFEDMNKINEEWIIEGYLNDIKEPGEYFGKYKVLGASNEVVDYVNKGYYIHYALHINAKDKFERVKIFKGYNIPLEANATAIHPSAYIMEGTKIGFGVLIAPYAITSFGPTIGNFCHLYSGAFVGHDSIVQDFSTLTARSVLGARVKVNEGAHIGLNSCIREDITIGKYSIVGMGSVIIKNVDDFSIIAGNPGKFIKSLKLK